MKAIVVPGGKFPRLEDKEWSLPQLQEAVGGYIEPVDISHYHPHALMWANEEGLMERLPTNTIATALAGSRIVGDVVIVGKKGQKTVDVPGMLIGLLEPEE